MKRVTILALLVMIILATASVAFAENGPKFGPMNETVNRGITYR